MDRKSIKEKRIKGYFVEAAKKVINEEGVDGLTVKKVANLAGYAPGTLYNYFTDLNGLLFNCVVEFFSECEELSLKELEKCKTAKEKVINLSIVYSKYFIDNPNIYQLLFLEDLGEQPEEFKGEEGYIPEVVRLSQKNLMECAEQGIIKRKDIDIIQALIANSVQGNLLFYIKERSQMTKEEVLKKIEREVKYLLD